MTTQVESRQGVPEQRVPPALQARAEERADAARATGKGDWIGAVAAGLLLLAVLAAICGVTALAVGTAPLAKAFFATFLLLFSAVLVMSLVVRGGTGETRDERR